MDETIEIFGKRLKVVVDENNSGYFCKLCDIRSYCWKGGGDPICEDADGKENRHFEEVNEVEESDDERIRRKFIEALKECGFTHFPNDFTIDEAITWLKKQGKRLKVKEL